MDTLLWIAQIILAAAFLIAGSAKLFAYKPLVARLETHPRRTVELSRGMAAIVGVLEIIGALGVLIPAALLPANLGENYLLVRLAAAGLAVLMLIAAFYHARRREPAAPAATLFLLALFIIVGRWPH